MELTKRVAVASFSASGAGLARRVATSLGDAETPCFSMVLVHGRRFVWN